MATKRVKAVIGTGLVLAATAAPVSVRAPGGVPTVGETHACAQASATAENPGGAWYCRPNVGYVCEYNGVIWLDHELVWLPYGGETASPAS